MSICSNDISFKWTYKCLILFSCESSSPAVCRSAEAIQARSGAHGRGRCQKKIDVKIFLTSILLLTSKICCQHFVSRRYDQCTHGPEILATRNTSYLTASKSLNDQKIARMAMILTIFGQK